MLDGGTVRRGQFDPQPTPSTFLNSPRRAVAMTTAADVLRGRVARRDRFSYNEIAALIADASDLDVWSAVYLALGQGDDHIKPEPGMEVTCSFFVRYLLRCVR